MLQTFSRTLETLSDGVKSTILLVLSRMGGDGFKCSEALSYLDSQGESDNEHLQYTVSKITEAEQVFLHSDAGFVKNWFNKFFIVSRLSKFALRIIAGTASSSSCEQDFGVLKTTLWGRKTLLKDRIIDQFLNPCFYRHCSNFPHATRILIFNLSHMGDHCITETKHIELQELRSHPDPVLS